MAKKKHKKSVAGFVTPQHHQLQLKFPQLPRWEQMQLVFPKYERPAPPPPKPFLFVFDGFVGGYERRGIYNLEDVFNFLHQDRDFGGDIVKLVSQRYYLFAENHKCVRCGLAGLYFAKERSAKMVKIPIEGTGRHSIEYRPLNGERSSWHLNLYALKTLPNGELREILMTKDHILPKAKGGLDIMSNYQTMCCICNGHKADKIIVAPATHEPLPEEVPVAVE